VRGPGAGHRTPYRVQGFTPVSFCPPDAGIRGCHGIVPAWRGLMDGLSVHTMIAVRPPLWMDRALAWIYPDVCQVCQSARASAAEGYVCPDCARTVRFIRPPFCHRCGLPFEGEITDTFECGNCRGLKLHFESARSAVLARGVVLDAVHRYKYHGAVWFERFLAGLLVREAAPALAERSTDASEPGGPEDAGGTGRRWDVIVPVPLHPVREREREFNQARRLAVHLGRATGIPVRTDWLERLRATHTQTTLTRGERVRNMNRAFRLRSGACVEGVRCVIVDDVFTTGATTSACARVLKAAGARAVCVWTVARGV